MFQQQMATDENFSEFPSMVTFQDPNLDLKVAKDGTIVAYKSPPGSPKAAAATAPNGQPPAGQNGAATPLVSPSPHQVSAAWLVVAIAVVIVVVVDVSVVDIDGNPSSCNCCYGSCGRLYNRVS